MTKLRGNLKINIIPENEHGLGLVDFIRNRDKNHIERAVKSARQHLIEIPAILIYFKYLKTTTNHRIQEVILKGTI